MRCFCIILALFMVLGLCGCSVGLTASSDYENTVASTTVSSSSSSQTDEVSSDPSSDSIIESSSQGSSSALSSSSNISTSSSALSSSSNISTSSSVTNSSSDSSSSSSAPSSSSQSPSSSSSEISSAQSSSDAPSSSEDTDSTQSEEPNPLDDLLQGETFKKIIGGINILCQYPELPTGCETVSTVMALQRSGVDITCFKFAKEWLERGTVLMKSDGSLYGDSPYEVFIGSPFSEGGYGCFAPVIEKAVKNNCSAVTVNNLTGMAVSDICTEYIDNDIPVVMWITYNLCELTKGRSWYLNNGELFVWPSGEHCALLVGYSDLYYYFCDPIYGKLMHYDREKVELRYSQMGSQALAFIPNE